MHSRQSSQNWHKNRLERATEQTGINEQAVTLRHYNGLVPPKLKWEFLALKESVGQWDEEFEKNFVNDMLMNQICTALACSACIAATVATQTS